MRNKSRLFLGKALLLICASVFLVAQAAELSQADFVQHRDAEYGFTIQYPDDWAAVEATHAQTRIKAVSQKGRGEEDFSVAVTPLGRTISDEEFVAQADPKAYEKYLASVLPSAVLLDHGPITLANKKAYCYLIDVVHQTMGVEIPMRQLQMQTVNKDQVYTLTFRASPERFREVRPTFMAIAVGFVFLPDEPAAKTDAQAEPKFLSYEEAFGTAQQPQSYSFEELAAQQPAAQPATQSPPQHTATAAPATDSVGKDDAGMTFEEFVGKPAEASVTRWVGRGWQIALWTIGAVFGVAILWQVGLIRRRMFGWGLVAGAKRLIRTKQFWIGVAVFLMLWLAWPTMYRYDDVKYGGKSFSIRTNRVTGTVQVYRPGHGWRNE